MNKLDKQLPVVMTIAGSDSGGGAGIQADLKTVTAMGCFGTTAITCITAQNPAKVAGVESISPEMVALQIKTVSEAFSVSAVKTGMLYSTEIIRVVVSALEECNLHNIVVDPVMIATSGAKLLKDDAVEAMLSELIPRASVITPNLPEAEVLIGHSIDSIETARITVLEISEKYGVDTIITGGHFFEKINDSNTEVVDVLCADGQVELLKGAFIAGAQTHGTGCTFSAALAAGLAIGKSLPEAAKQAKSYVVQMLKERVA